MTERERERMIQVFFARFKSEAELLWYQKILSREEWSSLASSFARIAADTYLAALADRDACLAQADAAFLNEVESGWLNPIVRAETIAAARQRQEGRR